MDVPTKTAAEKWRAILPVLDEHTGWFHDLMAFLFYPEHEAQGPALLGGPVRRMAGDRCVDGRRE